MFYITPLLKCISEKELTAWKSNAVVAHDKEVKPVQILYASKLSS